MIAWKLEASATLEAEVFRPDGGVMNLSSEVMFGELCGLTSAIASPDGDSEDNFERVASSG